MLSFSFFFFLSEKRRRRFKCASVQCDNANCREDQNWRRKRYEFCRFCRFVETGHLFAYLNYVSNETFIQEVEGKNNAEGRKMKSRHNHRAPSFIVTMAKAPFLEARTHTHTHQP